MSRTDTVADMIDRVRRLGDYKSSVGDQSGYTDTNFYMSDTTIIQFLDEAYSEAYEYLSDADEDWQAVRWLPSLSASVSLYTLPSDFYKLRAVEVQDPSPAVGYRVLPHATVDDDVAALTQDVPRAYRLLDNNIEIVPTPNLGGASGTLRVTYVPEAPVLSSSLQSVDTDCGLGELAVYGATMRCKAREEKPFTEIQYFYDRRLDRSVTSLRRRDRASPRRLRDPRNRSWPGWPTRRY